ncbi:hypothetical protein QO009_000561 [Brevibacillus aydinogluensis]|jgi:hypothetical protein|uniref:DUF4129 domain-containing protein n=1 Tax=Brevibacillus aydinogluensis TaxID=927786 RepID=UPI000E3A1C8A|nr:DUF4129 domain-containing protein [Brevibacillus aydinogluensis]MDT3414717.1 hypothetical protein [Brevibacillus aydinogluensis]REK62997.1 MAG: DUF4129 domain-containing protein [Brevibacillus sp.]
MAAMIDADQLSRDKERLAQILSADEYAVRAEEGKSWLDVLMEPIVEMISRLLKHADVSPGAVSTLSGVIIIAALIGLFVLIIWLISRMVRTVQRKAAPISRGEHIRTHADCLREAKEMGQRGEWREGMRLMFLSLLLYLQEQSWIRVEKWKTNWEYMDELRERQPALEPLFRRHAHAFEQVWYGRKRVEESVFWQHVSELEQQWSGEGQHGDRR